MNTQENLPDCVGYATGTVEDVELTLYDNAELFSSKDFQVILTVLLGITPKEFSQFFSNNSNTQRVFYSRFITKYAIYNSKESPAKHSEIYNRFVALVQFLLTENVLVLSNLDSFIEYHQQRIFNNLDLNCSLEFYEFAGEVLFSYFDPPPDQTLLTETQLKIVAGVLQHLNQPQIEEKYYVGGVATRISRMFQALNILTTNLDKKSDYQDKWIQLYRLLYDQGFFPNLAESEFITILNTEKQFVGRIATTVIEHPLKKFKKEKKFKVSHFLPLNVAEKIKEIVLTYCNLLDVEMVAAQLALPIQEVEEVVTTYQGFLEKPRYDLRISVED